MLKQERQERERAEAELTLARTRSAEKKAQLAAWTVLINTLYNLDITKTRE